jgi:hypothetical protein
VLDTHFKCIRIVSRVAATAVNRADTLQRRGLYPAPPSATQILGLEAAGEYMQDILAKSSPENRNFEGFSFMDFMCNYR